MKTYQESKGDDKMKLYERIQMLRKKAGLSQEQLGVSRQTVSKWENGGASPGMERLQELADALGITLAELLGTDVQATTDDKLAEYEEEIVRLKKKRSAHIIFSVCIFLAVGVLILLFNNLFGRMQSMNDSIQMLEGEVSGIYDNMDSKISEITEQLAKKDSLAADYQIEPVKEMIKKGKMVFSVRVTPAQWKEEMEAEIIMEGEDTYTAPATFQDGSFRAQISVLLEESTLSCALRLMYGEETHTQILEYVSVGDWVMTVGQENELYFTQVKGEYKIQGTAVTVHTLDRLQ